MSGWFMLDILEVEVEWVFHGMRKERSDRRVSSGYLGILY